MQEISSRDWVFTDCFRLHVPMPTKRTFTRAIQVTTTSLKVIFTCEKLATAHTHTPTWLEPVLTNQQWWWCWLCISDRKVSMNLPPTLPRCVLSNDSLIPIRIQELTLHPACFLFTSLNSSLL